MHLRHWFVRLVTLLMSVALLVGATSITHAATGPNLTARQDLLVSRLAAKQDPLLSKMARVHPNAPSYTSSYYESTTSPGTLQSQGCSAARGPSGVVVLDFGEPDYASGSYGTYDFGGHFDSDNTIFHAVANFIYGAWNCHNQYTNIAVAIGTSNYYGALSGSSSVWYAAGQAWGNVVNQDENYSVSNHYNNQIGAFGADDIETEWANYSLSSNFVNGYNSASSRVFFDYGDDTPGYWSNAQVWYVAWGARANVPLPEIYYNADATQDWEPLSVWACSNEGGAIGFKGTMAEYPYGGNTPDQAWTDMYNAEGTNSCTASARGQLIFSTNI